MGEYLNGIQGVVGSSPISSTITYMYCRVYYPAISLYKPLLREKVVFLWQAMLFSENFGKINSIMIYYLVLLIGQDFAYFSRKVRVHHFKISLVK